MRKLIVLSFVSIDGVMQAPGGPEEDTSGNFAFGGWTVPFFDEFAGAVMGEQMKPPFELLLGRRTYDIFAGYWPSHSEGWPGINDVAKYVASRGTLKLTWSNSFQLQGDVAKAVAQLKAKDGPPIQVHGSGNLIQTLLAHDLVDEYWLKTFPLILGKGKRLFGDAAAPVGFKLLDCKASPSGVVIASYARSGEIKTGSF